MGIFEVSEANRTAHFLELKAYDHMLRFERDFKLGLAVAPFLPIQQLLHVKAIPFLGEYSWEIYGCYEKKQQNNAVIQELEAYLENQSYLLS